MTSEESVVLLHDNKRVWLSLDDGGLMRGFRHPLPDDFTMQGNDDWETTVFSFLPSSVLRPVRGCGEIARVPRSLGGYTRIFDFDADLPDSPADLASKLGAVGELKLSRLHEAASTGRIGDADTLAGLYALALYLEREERSRP